jgi:hypothetical protein
MSSVVNGTRVFSLHDDMGLREERQMSHTHAVESCGRYMSQTDRLYAEADTFESRVLIPHRARASPLLLPMISMYGRLRSQLVGSTRTMAPL